MQVTETLAEGLKREFKVVLPAAELEERLTSELQTLKDRVRLNGFRPGKVPVAHLRKLYGRSVMAEVVQNAVTEANRKIVDENGLRLAMEPKIDFPETQDEIVQALDAKSDLAFTVALEVLPSFDLADLSDVRLEKLVATVPDEDIEQSLQRFAQQSRPYTARAEGEPAESGDRVVVDFSGTIDGEPFEGGKGEAITVDLGSGSFIPGFEEALIGAKAGERREVTARFPANYLAEHLAGKEARFDVTVREVLQPGEVAIDDDLAKSLGMDSLDALKAALRTSLQRELDLVSRGRLKKGLLDALDARYAFDLPAGLVEQEFAAVWSQVLADLKNNNKTFADEGTTEDAAREEYRRIAERRVRLGLVLAQIGDSADIKVTDDELNRALAARVRQYPGQEREVWDHFRKNPQAMAEIRAPVFEEKVVDHILAQVTVDERAVAKDELLADQGEGEDEAKPGEAAA